MKLTDMLKAIARLRETTARLRGDRIDLSRHARALDHEQVRKYQTDAARMAARRQRRADVVAKRKKEIADAAESAALLNAARDLYSADAYLKAARLWPLSKVPELTGDLADTYENAADRRRRIATEENNRLLQSVVERMDRREIADELRAAGAEAIAERLRELDVSTERGAAELRMIRSEIAGRDALTGAKVRDALDGALQRLALPKSFEEAAVILRELDLFGPLFEANAEALASGNDTMARNLESAHYVVSDGKGGLVSLEAEGGGLADRSRWVTVRAEEAHADAEAVQRMATEIVRAAAVAGMATGDPLPPLRGAGRYVEVTDNPPATPANTPPSAE